MDSDSFIEALARTESYFATTPVGSLPKFTGRGYGSPNSAARKALEEVARDYYSALSPEAVSSESNLSLTRQFMLYAQRLRQKSPILPTPFFKGHTGPALDNFFLSLRSLARNEAQRQPAESLRFVHGMLASHRGTFHSGCARWLFSGLEAVAECGPLMAETLEGELEPLYQRSFLYLARGRKIVQGWSESSEERTPYLKALQQCETRLLQSAYDIGNLAYAGSKPQRGSNWMQLVISVSPYPSLAHDFATGRLHAGGRFQDRPDGRRIPVVLLGCTR